MSSTNRAARYIAIDRGAFEPDDTFVVAMPAPPAPVFPLAERLTVKVLFDLLKFRAALPSQHENL